MIFQDLHGYFRCIINELFEISLRFEQLLDRQFSAKMKCFPSDGGGEFMSDRFQQHQQGILHKVTCSYTPQQNITMKAGTDRSIVEIGLAQLS